MSWHNLVSAQNHAEDVVAPLTSNVCIICSIIIYVKHFVMSLPTMSFGDWFSVSRKGGTGGGGFVYTLKG